MLCVCAGEKEHGQAWIRESTLKLSGSWAVGCCRLPKGKVSSGAPWEQHGTCGWQRHGAEDGAGLSWSARGSPSIYTNIYIYIQTHIKRNSCFSALTCITSITASYGLRQKTQPILSHIFAFDFSGWQVRPWGCPVHSTVRSPTFPSVHLKGGHWCVSIMQPLPARYQDRSIKGNTTARFREFQNWGQTQ